MNQYDKVKKYKKKRIGLITTRNIVLITIIVATLISVGYSYWNTSLKIIGTVTAVSEPAVAGDIYDPDDLVEGTHTFNGSPEKPTVTVSNGVVKEYSFTDTNGVDINANPIDTGFIPYQDGKNYEITMQAIFPPDDNKKQGGVLLDISTPNDSSALRLAYPVNSKIPKLYINNSPKSITFTSTTSTIDLKITYKNGSLSMTINNKPVTSFGFENLSLDGMRLLLGYTTDSNGNKTRQAVANITQFTVKEI